MVASFFSISDAWCACLLPSRGDFDGTSAQLQEVAGEHGWKHELTSKKTTALSSARSCANTWRSFKTSGAIRWEKWQADAQPMYADAPVLKLRRKSQNNAEKAS